MTHEETPGFQNLCCVLPSLLCFPTNLALFVGPGSAARIVRSGILWWLAVLGGDNCHSGGPIYIHKYEQASCQIHGALP